MGFNILFDDKVLIWTIYIILAGFALETVGVQTITGLFNYIIYGVITVRLVLSFWGVIALYQLWYGRL